MTTLLSTAIQTYWDADGDTEASLRKVVEVVVSECAQVTNQYFNDEDWDNDTAEAIMHAILALSPRAPE